MPVDAGGADYDDVGYWDERYQTKNDSAGFDWLLSFVDLKEILNSTCSATDKILSVGCGNSPLSLDMYDAGYENQVCIDNSSTVIAQMQEQEEHIRSKIVWQCMDATHTSLANEAIDVVLDKGLLDCLLCDETSANAGATLAHKYIAEIHRLLSSKGRAIIISFNSEDDISQYFEPENFSLKTMHVSNPQWRPGRKNNKVRSRCSVPVRQNDQNDIDFLPFLLCAGVSGPYCTQTSWQCFIWHHRMHRHRRGGICCARGIFHHDASAHPLAFSRG